jgi:prefoldin alpha subunit
MDKVQEKYYEMQILNSHIEQIETNLDKIDEQINEVNVILKSLDEFKNIEVNNEILVPISNGIFAKAKLLNNEKLIVNVGQDVVTEKNVEQTKELISKQLVELDNYRELLTNELNKLFNKVQMIEKEADELVKE